MSTATTKLVDCPVVDSTPAPGLVAVEVGCRNEVDDGQRVVHDCRVRVGDDPPLPVPPRAIEEEAVDVDAVLGRRRKIGTRLGLKDLVREAERVDRNGVAARVHLQDPRHEALREEEGRQRVARHARDAGEQPAPHEGDALLQVLDP
eukprot:scaffold1658_cov115-Isochrysis_galbana.AAC.10